MATTTVPDSWSELALISVIPRGGSEIGFGALTEEISGMDWGEKDIEGLKMISGGNVVRRVPMTDESITMSMIPIGVGTSTETTATGIMQLFHPTGDVSQPLAVSNTTTRDRYKVTLLWATTLPATAETLPAAGEPAMRIQIFNAYLTVCKPSFDEYIKSAEVTFKWPPFTKGAVSNKTEDSTDDTVQLDASTAFT